MQINSSSPLQNWLERIHDYLSRDEILKARFASLLLPIFEAYEFLSVVKQICFRSSQEQPETLSNLIYKATILAYNILFAGIEGFKNPETTYQFHKETGLLGRLAPSLDEEEDQAQVEFEEEESPIVEEEVLSREETTDSTEQDNSSEEAVSQPQPVVDQSPRRFEENYHSLKTAPSLLEKKVSSRMIQQPSPRISVINKGKSLSEPMDSPLNNGLPETRVNSFPLTTPLRTSKVHFRESPGSPLTPAGDESTPSLPEDELTSIQLLIQQPIQQGGSWKVKKSAIKFSPSTTFHIDSSIIDLLAQAQKKGAFLKLNLDQAFNLHQNLKVFGKYFNTLKAHHFDELISITQAIQNQVIVLWVLEDYQLGKFYDKCSNLIRQMISFIQSGEGVAKEGCARLFEQSSSTSASEIFEEWQNANLLNTQTDLTVYDYYEILRIYLENMPEDVQNKWSALKDAKSHSEWKQAIARLPNDDKMLILSLLKLLREAYLKIWPTDLDDMLIAVKSLLRPICPKMDLENSDDEENVNLDYLRATISQQKISQSLLSL